MTTEKVSAILLLIIFGIWMLMMQVGKDGAWGVGGLGCFGLAWVYGYLMRRR